MSVFLLGCFQKRKTENKNNKKAKTKQNKTNKKATETNKAKQKHANKKQTYEQAKKKPTKQKDKTIQDKTKQEQGEGVKVFNKAKQDNILYANKLIDIKYSMV